VLLTCGKSARGLSPAGRNNIYVTVDNGSMSAQIQSRPASGADRHAAAGSLCLFAKISKFWGRLESRISFVAIRRGEPPGGRSTMIRGIHPSRQGGVAKIPRSLNSFTSGNGSFSFCPEVGDRLLQPVDRKLKHGKNAAYLTNGSGVMPGRGGYRV